MMFLVHHDLSVVPDDSRAFSACCHGPRAGICHRQPSVRLPVQLPPDLREVTHFPTQASNLFVQAHGRHIETCWTGPVCRFDCVEVSLNAFVDLLSALDDPAGCPFLVEAVFNLELAAIDCRHVIR